MTRSGGTSAAGSNLAQGMSNRSNQVAKLTVGSLDDTTLTVEAHYNPKELEIKKSIPWKMHENLPAVQNKPEGERHDEAEITSLPTRSMSIELLFDGYEANSSVQPELDKLEVMTAVQAPGSSNEHMRRPHHCVITWGSAGYLPFRCVIKEMATKVTMFAPNGTALRATCTLTLNEVKTLKAR